jgi:hypothetical protein
MTTTGFCKFSPMLCLILIGLVFSLHPTGRTASVASAEASSGDPIQIVFGTDVTLTTMNFFETVFEEDPLNPGLPAPSVRVATSSGDTALAMNSASPGQAGVARAKIGIFYDLLPPPDVSWEDIKDLPLEVIVNFEYTVSAQYTDGEGSANAGLGIAPFTSPWYDFLGSETGETGSRSDSVIVSYVTTFDDLADTLFFEAYSQAHLTPSGVESVSQADVQVNGITFDFAPLPPDLSADAIEVTQAVQDLNNSVRLVAGKRAFVRFHAVSNGSTFRTFAHLEITFGGTAHTIYPSTPGYYVNVRPTPNRGMTTHAFLFEIPLEFTFAGELEIVAVLNPDNAWRDRDPEELTYTNNSITTTVTFEDVPVVNLVLHRMVYTLNGTSHTPPISDATRLPDWMERAFPLSELKVWHRVTSYSDPAVVNDNGNLTDPTCERINSQLLWIRRWERIFGSGAIPAGAHYYGMVADSGGFMRGCAELPGYAASGPSGIPRGQHIWDTDGTYGDWYGAHELAHSYGREHANFCGAVGGPAYPYPEGKISPTETGATALYGFDINTRAIYDPLWKDVMTYCPLQWISDFTYEALMTIFQTTPVQAPESGLVDDYLTVSGFVNLQTGEVEMAPVYLLEDVTNPLPPTPGDYAIILRNAAGDELAITMFTPLLYETGASNPDHPQEAEQHFLLLDEMIPYVTGTASIDIVGPDGLLDTISAGPTAPTITLISPNGGEILPGPTVTITWEGSDPDGDPLDYHLQYSPDAGATWTSVAQGVISETATINSISLKASSTALFRVWASDGLHSASDTSDASFSVPNHPPFAVIELPATDVTVVVSETVAFKGFAFDSDNGPLGPGMLTWTSNLDGVLAAGDEFSVANLSLGVHTITFLIEDGEGGGMIDSVVVTVVANPTVAPPPDDQLIAGPTAINLGSVEAPITGTLFIENQNLDSSLAWEASASESWVSLSAVSGTTLAEITVSFINTDLPPGINVATITLTSDELPGETVVVSVQIFNEQGEKDFQIFLPVMMR